MTSLHRLGSTTIMPIFSSNQRLGINALHHLHDGLQQYSRRRLRYSVNASGFKVGVSRQIRTDVLYFRFSAIEISTPGLLSSVPPYRDAK